MSLILCGAAKGAPGVTTTAAALAAVWPSSVLLVEADPAGSDLQMLTRTDNGHVLVGGRRGAGILGMASSSAGRADLLKFPIAQATDLGIRLIVGPPHSRSSRAMGGAWHQIAAALAQLAHEGEHDVLVDVGRLDDTSPAMPLLNRADAILLLARRNLRGIAHTRTTASILEEHMRIGSATTTPARAGLVLIEDPATPARVQTQWQLASKGLTQPWPILATLPHDPEGAAALFTPGAPARDTSRFIEAVRTAASDLHGLTRQPRPLATDATPTTAGRHGAPRADGAEVTTSPGSLDSAPAGASTRTGVTSGSSSSRDTAASTIPSAEPLRPWPPLPPGRQGTARRTGPLRAELDVESEPEHEDQFPADETSTPADATPGTNASTANPASRPSGSSSIHRQLSPHRVDLDRTDERDRRPHDQFAQAGAKNQ